MAERQLVPDVHRGLPLPAGELLALHLVRGQYDYWHYGCDGLDDRGWGCGYRTLQTLASWILKNGDSSEHRKMEQVPTLGQIQQTLVDLEDKPKRFVGSRDWIGSFEVCLALDQLFGVPCKILNVSSGSKLKDQVPVLKKHFGEFGSPVMMGGDADATSKGIFGVCSVRNLANGQEEDFLLVVDPHFWRPANLDSDGMRKALWEDNWIVWKNLNEFMTHSFYNLCLPQIKCNDDR